MANDDDAEAVAQRLEQALERIAALAAGRPAQVANPAESADLTAPAVDGAAIAARLDSLIAEMRAALAGS